MPSSGSLLAREGDYWRIYHAGASVAVRDSKGTRYIAELLSQPHTNIPAIRFAYGAQNAATLVRNSMHQQPILERDAVLSLREATADDSDDAGRLLKRAVRPDGRSRAFRDDHARAREAVTKAIGYAIARIKRSAPELGQHLSQTISTGRYCRYEPGEGISWEVRGLRDV